MNFTLKALVAAAALVAAGSANAAINNVNSASGADIFVAVYDSANKYSAIFDIGQSFEALNSATLSPTTAPITFDLSTFGSAWASFAAVANLPAVQWGVFSGQKTSANASVIVETLNGTPTATSAYKQNTVNSQNLNITNFLNTAANNGLSTGGSIFTQGTTNAPYAGTGVLFGTTGRMNATGSKVVSLLDTSMSIVSYTALVNQPTAGTLWDQTSSGIRLTLSSAGVLTYAVPEADTYAMLLAGLGVMGFVARRRLAA